MTKPICVYGIKNKKDFEIAIAWMKKNGMKSKRWSNGRSFSHEWFGGASILDEYQERGGLTLSFESTLKEIAKSRKLKFNCVSISKLKKLSDIEKRLDK